VSPVRYELGFYIPEDDILYKSVHVVITNYRKLVECGGFLQ
jgi:hypothetical protein